MKFSTKQFFDGTPVVFDLGLTIVISSLAVGFAIAIAKSDILIVSKSGIRAEKQALLNHEALKQSLIINQYQQQEFDRLKSQVKKLSNRSPAVRSLAKEFEETEKRIPKEQITELSEVVEQSEEVLELIPKSQ